MGDLINPSTIWKLVGSVSAIIGVLCFGFSSTFTDLFGEWDYRRFLVYIFDQFICPVLHFAGQGNSSFRECPKPCDGLQFSSDHLVLLLA